jgi:hypothetical protein
MKKEGGSSSSVPGFMYSAYHVTLIHPIEPSIILNRSAHLRHATRLRELGTVVRFELILTLITSCNITQYPSRPPLFVSRLASDPCQVPVIQSEEVV